jgi:superfamily II helicase
MSGPIRREIEEKKALKVDMKGVCDFCRTAKAVKKVKLKGGIKAQLCQRCYDEELRVN